MKRVASSPLEQTAQSLGITTDQIASVRDRLVTSIEGLAGSIIPLFAGLVSAILDVILVAVLSIYFLAGAHEYPIGFARICRSGNKGG